MPRLDFDRFSSPRFAQSSTLFRERLFCSREETVSRISEGQMFDVAIIGGGIHGACAARLAQEQGLAVLLLESGDYASGTSSRSSKMAHGGLRYLEMLDFQQVFEGIKAREKLFDELPSLVQPEHFLIPIPSGNLWMRGKLKIGLLLYDLMVRNPSRRHRWIPRRDLSYTGFSSTRSDLMGCFQYTDGLFNDARLVTEHITAARAHGALCLNYAHVRKLVPESSNSSVAVEWSDTLSGQTHTSRASVVLNCAGPWAPFLAPGLSEEQARASTRYSRGSHLIFSTRWTSPSLFLPMEEKGRYYFVWPHRYGTMVGTTEREVSALETDPLPSRDEVDELMTRVARDIPDAGLSRETLIYAFAGVRTLPLRRADGNTSRLSRKHTWRLDDRVLTLFGGKFTTYEWTAREGLELARRLLSRPSGPVPSEIRQFGAIAPHHKHEVMETLTAQFDIDTSLAASLTDRLGAMLAWYQDDTEPFTQTSDGSWTRTDLIHGLKACQVHSIEDLLRRRLDVEYSSHHGLRDVDLLRTLFHLYHPSYDFDLEIDRYRDRMARIESLLSTTI